MGKDVSANSAISASHDGSRSGDSALTDVANDSSDWTAAPFSQANLAVWLHTTSSNMGLQRTTLPAKADGPLGPFTLWPDGLVITDFIIFNRLYLLGSVLSA